jgi:hypothetical protein
MNLDNRIIRLSVCAALASTLASPQIAAAQPIILSASDNAVLGWKDWVLITIAAITVDAGNVEPKPYNTLLARNLDSATKAGAVGGDAFQSISPSPLADERQPRPPLAWRTSLNHRYWCQTM